MLYHISGTRTYIVYTIYLLSCHLRAILYVTRSSLYEEDWLPWRGNWYLVNGFGFEKASMEADNLHGCCFLCSLPARLLLVWSRLWSNHDLARHRIRLRLWWARIRQLQSGWESSEAGIINDILRLLYRAVYHLYYTSQQAPFLQNNTSYINIQKHVWKR